MPHGSTVQLFAEISGLLERHCEISEDDLLFLTHFAFASIFSDCIDIPPCLLLSGSRSEAVTILRLMRWVCRHPIPLADGRLHDFPEGLNPTRLIGRPGVQIEKVLGPLQLPGFGVCRGKSFHQESSATAMFVSDAELESSLAEGCLRISLAPWRRFLSGADEQNEEPAIQELQAKLLDYRLQYFARVKKSSFDIPAFSGPTRQLARTLGACLFDAPELQNRLVTLLQPLHEVARSDRISTITCTLLESLVTLCHERRASTYVGEVAEVTNQLLARRNETLRLSPRETGGHLKSLGFHTVRLDSGGRGLRFGQADYMRVHKLARSYGAPALEKGLQGCPHCKELRGD
jgi:hypothetical protein